jgi:hypothetical protein
METDDSSQNAVVLRILGAGQSPKNSLNFCVVQHHHNPLESAGSLFALFSL